MTAARRKPARPDASADLIALAARTPGAKVLSVATTAAKKRPGKNKYGAIRTAHNGVNYDSRAEAAYAVQLDRQLAAGEIAGWVRQVTFMLGVPENTYKVDFVVFPSASKPYARAAAVEIKGVETAAFKKNKRLWKRYGFLPLVIVTGGKVVETITPEAIDWARPEGGGGEN